MNLPCTIKFAVNELRTVFLALAQGDQAEKELFEELNAAFNKIRMNAFSGTQISKKLIPTVYTPKYSVRNLWKYNISGGWRVIYHIKAEESIVLGVILEWFTHKDYERRFRY